MQWDVSVTSVYYEDTGLKKVRITHTLTGMVWADDVVLFELAFRPGSLGSTVDKASIGEDYVQCEMSQSSSDTQYWTAKVAEGFYECAPVSEDDATDVCWNIYQDEEANYS